MELEMATIHIESIGDNLSLTSLRYCESQPLDLHSFVQNLFHPRFLGFYLKLSLEPRESTSSLGLEYINYRRFAKNNQKIIPKIIPKDKNIIIPASNFKTIRIVFELSYN